MRTYRPCFTLVAVAAFTRAAVADPCLDRASSLRDQAVSEAKVALCFDAPASCWTFDLAARTWAHAAPGASEKLPGAIQRPPPAPTLSIQLTANIRSCDKGGKDCRLIDVPDVAAADSTTVVTTADRSLVALYGPHGVLSMFDGKTAKLLAQIKPWMTPMGDARIDSAQFLGQTLLVLENHSPVTSTGRLFNRNGVKLADAGPGIGLTGDVIHVAANEWAFTTLETSRVYVDDVKTGKHVAMIAAVLGKAPNPLAGVAIVHRTADAKTLVIASGDAGSGVVLYDIATRGTKRFTPPVCK